MTKTTRDASRTVLLSLLLSCVDGMANERLLLDFVFRQLSFK